MSSHRPLTRTAPLAVLALATLGASAADIIHNAGSAVPAARARAMSEFKAINSASNFYTHDNGRIGRVYGRAFSHGNTAAASTRAFVQQHADMWGVDAADLVAEGPFHDRAHTQQVMYQPEFDAYKFTATYYTQTRAGIPVFNSTLVLLTRNEQDNPLVLASSSLKDLSNFNPDPMIARAAINRQAIEETAAARFNGVAQIFSTERVIYAGDDTNAQAPVVADNTLVNVDGFKLFRLITDATTGAVLHEEDMICHIDVEGNISGVATEGIAADFCEDEVPMALAHLNVFVQGGGSAVTDADGNFLIPNAGSADVTVDAELDGVWFDVIEFFGNDISESENGAPGTAFEVLFNAVNSSEQVRAQVNAYIESNRIRDLVLQANPSFPRVENLQNFPVYVNRTDGFCPGNAWYDPGEESINFCQSGSGYPNTAWSSVVHHEYGHHLVNAGGSTQGQYGEGMGDVMSLIILDSPELGVGFFGSCNGSLRSAINNLNYPCATDGHACAPLLSGAVWQTRQLLFLTEPDDYQDILMDLAVNSIFLHNYNLITPQITIDWLTLDDDDSDIGNGTPHYFEIDGGFSEHNMDAPPLNLVNITPVSTPDIVDPNGGTTISAEFLNVAGELDPSTPTLHVNTGSGYVEVQMVLQDNGNYEANIPSSSCGDAVSYYFSAETTNGLTQNLPLNAPASAYSATAAFDEPELVFADNANTDMGWSVSGGPSGSGEGEWERAIPGGNGSRGDAPDDFDGSGFAFVTGNGSDGSNTDVDGGTTILTSPTMDASGASVISYARWYDNTGSGTGADPGNDIFVVEVSDDNGSSWTELEVVGPSDSQSSGGWFQVSYNLGAVSGFEPNDQFRIRFSASDLGEGSVIEAAVDAIELSVFDCSSCPGDINGDGVLNFFDVSAFLNAFNSGDPAADFDGNGVYNFFDVSAFLNAFAAGCP